MTQDPSKNGIPAGDLPLLPLRNGVLFPATSTTIPVGRAASVALVKALSRNDLVLVGTQLDGSVESPTLSDLAPVATLARVRRVVSAGEDRYRLLVEGQRRVRLEAVSSTQPYLVVRPGPFEEPTGDPLAAEAAEDRLRRQLEQAAPLGGEVVTKVLATPRGQGAVLADRAAAVLGLQQEEEIRVLATGEVAARLALVSELLERAALRGELKQRIDARVRKERSEAQREHLLREQLRAIQKELGEDGEDELGRLRQRLGEKALPEGVREAAERELDRLEGGAAQAEAGVIRTWLDWVLELPWEDKALVKDDIDAVQKKLDEDHFGLEDVKQSILEHLAVQKMGGEARGTILCLGGPPGVGKTSLGQSIAEATGRPFVRIALGGVRDEAEIRGHRRTYVGARPGRLMTALKQAGARNAVVLLDEVDKLGRGWQGDPEAALLEVLDPEQNHTFTDHYLEQPFDLSEVLFLCTANDLGQLSAPLRDRLEILEIAGYTPQEKRRIATEHLLPKQLERHGLSEDLLRFEDGVLETLITGWTREAGVRQLQRSIRKLCRAVALRAARAPDGKPEALVVDAEALDDLLGRRRFFDEVAERTALPGVATGLAWTPTGGDVLFVETSSMPGRGDLQITGQLGDVMKESARAALTYLRSHADGLGVDPEYWSRRDLHIHVPAGAVPKDGPSAGVTMFTALASLATGRRVRPDVAMTGEATLRGRVLPVGGIKSKVLAAHRAGMSTVVLPERNRRDLDEVPEAVREAMDFVFATDMEQVLEVALLPLEAVARDGRAAESGANDAA